MTGAVATMAFAAIEAELAHRHQIAGHEAGTRRHGGLALILFAFSAFVFLNAMVFG